MNDDLVKVEKDQILNDYNRQRLAGVFTGMAFALEALVAGVDLATANDAHYPPGFDINMQDVRFEKLRMMHSVLAYRRMADAVRPKQPAKGSEP